MPDLNGWPVWPAIIVIVIMQLTIMLKEPIKNAMPTAITNWFKHRQQQQLQRYLKSYQGQEAVEETNQQLTAFLIDETNKKLDKVIAGQDSFNVRFSIVEVFVQGAIKNGTSKDKKPQRDSEIGTQSTIPAAASRIPRTSISRARKPIIKVEVVIIRPPLTRRTLKRNM